MNQNHLDWENPINFEKFNVKKVTVYSKEIKKNGKIKKDSLLLKQFEYNKEKSKIKGTNHNWLFINHGGGSHRQYYNFENDYSKDNLITKRSIFHVSSEKKEKEKINNNSTIEEFKYDSYDNIIENIVYNKNINIYLLKKDTFNLFISINNPKITQFEYDLKNRKTKKYISTDSSTYYSKFDMKSEFKISKSCTYCEEKYLQQEWKYDDDKLLEWTTYTYKKEKHTKRNYFYDENQNLVKQIDSTGWYLGKPSLSSIKEIRYDDNIKIEIQTNFNDDSYFKKETKKFDNNQLVYEFLEAEYPEYNVETTYTYSESSIKKTTNRFKNGITVEEYFFDKKGLLIEQKTYLNAILIEYKKYYYE